MSKYLYVTILLGIFLHTSVIAQNVRCSGWVSDATSGERLIGVLVQNIDTRKAVQTDNYGFFATVVSNNQRLKIVYLGYQSDTIMVSGTRDTILQIQLKPISLREVVIRAEATQPDQGVGILNIPIAQLKSRPALLGEPDIIKALTLTPGVKFGTEGTTGLYVRGGTPDQNLMLLDGATVYNNSHLFGFVSVFNPDAIKSVTLYKGHMPARFGGRTSSVLDIVMKEGNNQERKTEMSTGLISSRLTTEGPIRKGKSSYLLSARSSYLGLLALPSFIRYRRREQANYANYWMYDINGKINFDLPNNSKFYLSIYTGQDNWRSYSKERDSNGRFGLDWGNQTITARYSKLLKNGGLGISQLTYNRYAYQVEEFARDNTIGESSEITYQNRSLVQDITWRNSARWSLRGGHQIETGIDLTHQTLAPQVFNTIGSADSLSVLPVTRYRGLLAAVFVEDRFRFASRWELQAGLRAGIFNTEETNFTLIEPRINLTYNLNKNINIVASWRHNYQPIHLLTTNGAGLPNDLWVPATARIKPARAHQWAIGTQYQARRDYIFSIEMYYRAMNRLIDFRQGINFFEGNTNWEQIIEANGRGRAYGLEVMAQKQAGNFNGWIAYTLAWNERQFSKINFGSWYPHQYDRRHELSVTGNYESSERWTWASNFVFSTGNAYTAPSFITLIDPDFPTVIFPGRNNKRAPVYHRLDLSVTKNFINKKKRAANWTFGVYNIYARRNPFYIDTNVGYIDGESSFIRQTVGSFFNFIPSVSYGIKL
jgi:outer membrane receptor for ferrienterochelin and colicin